MPPAMAVVKIDYKMCLRSGGVVAFDPLRGGDQRVWRGEGVTHVPGDVWVVRRLDELFFFALAPGAEGHGTTV